MTHSTRIETERLLLRPLTKRDAARMVELLNDREIADNMLGVPHPFTIMEAYARIHEMERKVRRGEEIHFAVETKEEHVMIGAIVLHLHVQHHRAELGYWMGRDYRGGGYMTEAAQRVVAFAFDELTLNRVFAYAFVHNAGSGRVLEKCGFQHEGTLRRDTPKNDVYLDVNFYGLLREDYEINQ